MSSKTRNSLTFEQVSQVAVLIGAHRSELEGKDVGEISTRLTELAKFEVGECAAKKVCKGLGVTVARKKRKDSGTKSRSKQEVLDALGELARGILFVAGEPIDCSFEEIEKIAANGKRESE